MARYGDEHKQATRRRIVETAGRRFKEDGIDGSGVATLMKDAGLTNGAFYGHFASKDDLVATTIADQLRQQRERLRDLPPGVEGLERYVEEYLSGAHRDDPGAGCPSAALIDEIARCSDEARQAYATGMEAIVDDSVARLDPEDVPAARLKVVSVFALMMGALQLSRVVADPRVSDAILGQGTRDALDLLRAASGR